MTESEKLRKEMEARGLLNTTQKKVIVNTSKEKKAGGNSASSLRSETKAKTTGTTAKKTANIPDTNLFKGVNVSKPKTKKLSGSDSDVLARAKKLVNNNSMSYAEKQ